MNLINDAAVISDVLNAFLKNKFPLTVWQNQFGDRVEKLARIYRFDEESHKLWLSSTQLFQKFDKDLFLFAHFIERELIFKTKINYTSENKMVLNTPREIKMLKARANERSNVIDQNIFIQYKFLADTHFSFRARLFDMSASGLGLIVSSTEANRFYIGDSISLKNYQGKSQGVKIVHKTPLNSFPLQKFHIGLSL